MCVCDVTASVAPSRQSVVIQAFPPPRSSVRSSSDERHVVNRLRGRLARAWLAGALTHTRPRAGSREVGHKKGGRVATTPAVPSASIGPTGVHQAAVQTVHRISRRTHRHSHTLPHGL